MSPNGLDQHLMAIPLGSEVVISSATPEDGTTWTLIRLTRHGDGRMVAQEYPTESHILYGTPEPPSFFLRVQVLPLPPSN